MGDVLVAANEAVRITFLTNLATVLIACVLIIVLGVMYYKWKEKQ